MSSAKSPYPTSANYLAEDMSLNLPSTLPAALQQTLPFNLTQIELCFHLAQAEDSLAELHHLFYITMGLSDYRTKQIGPS